jgi:hypothetical protein
VRSAADIARQAVLRSQAAPAAGAAGEKLAVESEDYCAEDDVETAGVLEGEASESGAARYGRAGGGEGMAEAEHGAHGTAHPTPTPRTGAPAPNGGRPPAAPAAGAAGEKLAVESEDYCAEDDA